MKSLLELNFPKSSFGRIVRFFDPGAAGIITSSPYILIAFNSYILLSTVSVFELFNRKAGTQWDLLLNWSFLKVIKMCILFDQIDC